MDDEGNNLDWDDEFAIPDILEEDDEGNDGSGMRRRRKRPHVRKPKVDIKIKNTGSLKKLGYSSKLPAKERRKSLTLAVHIYGYPETMRKINAAYVLNKNKPVGRIFESDKNWLEKLR